MVLVGVSTVWAMDANQRGLTMADRVTVSQETKDRITAFEEADKQFKEEWEAFEREHELTLVRLERLREERNARLDEAKRALRAETELLDDMRVTFTSGPFKIQKKWSDYYIPEKLVSMLTDRGLYDAAVSAGIVAVKTEIGNYDDVQKFLKDKGILRDFECCEDGEESSIAVSGPKTIPSPGAELKKE